jgi:hypothetical protein
MADTKISALSAATAALAAMELGVNDAATSKKLTVAQLGAWMGLNSGWRFLGQGIAASAAARTTDVIWTGSFNQLMLEYWIAGYAGGAIGRVIGGAGSISEAATTHCCELIEGVTRTTTCVSVCGWPTAVTVAAVPRFGIMFITNRAGQIKRMTGHGQHSGTAPTVVPTNILHNGLNSVTTQLDRLRLTSFSAITGNTVGSNLNAGTLFNVWGRNDD